MIYLIKCSGKRFALKLLNEESTLSFLNRQTKFKITDDNFDIDIF